MLGQQAPMQCSLSTLYPLFQPLHDVLPIVAIPLSPQHYGLDPQRYLGT